MNRRSVLAFVVLLFLALPVRGGGGGMPAPPWLYGSPVIAVIKEVPEGDWTAVKPPTVRVEVVDVLGGALKPGEMRLLWGGREGIEDTDAGLAREMEALRNVKVVP